jgi:hypothetical protein
MDNSSFPLETVPTPPIRPLAWQNALDVPVAHRQRGEARPGLLRRIAAGSGDAGLLVLVVLLIPVAILVTGTPVAIVVRLMVEAAKRW